MNHNFKQGDIVINNHDKSIMIVRYTRPSGCTDGSQTLIICDRTELEDGYHVPYEINSNYVTKCSIFKSFITKALIAAFIIFLDSDVVWTKIKRD